ncbi:MAG: putative lipid II flippase FtsW [Candidatus Moranbacteria bacterium]|nr:putative lipid II flippase FtsW [Candidatus Moranbacteria bacterium]MDD3964999.1 putative lipid II flippase FtsW [Candidatus Moranbacteria bacterium]
MKSLDRSLLIAVLILLGIGLLMIASAGVLYGRTRFGDAYYFFKEQLFGLGIGLILLYIFSRIDYRVWRRFVVPIFVVALGLLILVFIPGFGTSVYGATRWVEIGPISFQPSEVMKLSIILYLAAWLSQRTQKKTADLFEGFVPFLAILSLVGFLIIKQPDTGTLGLIFLIALSIFFASGANMKHIVSLFLLGLFSLFVLIRIAPYRMERFLVFLNPEYDSQGAGYQMMQALLALGSGGFFGAGLGQSRQKFNYLPEPVTDSIFAVLGEEFGFLGTTIVISLFLFIAWRGIRIALSAPDEFGKLLAVGIVSWVVLQAFINMSAISGLIPLTGISLPFISYGGTSLVVLLASIGILLNISKHSTLSTR